MEDKKCPCAAVAELKIMVKLLSDKVEGNEERIRRGEEKLSNDYTRLEVIASQMQGIASTMTQIQTQIMDLVNERREKECNLKNRVTKLIDDILRWGIFLLLGYVAMQFGLK